MEGDAHPILAGYIINISIHALRVEGDCRQVDDFRSTLRISIHALRVEGDDKARFWTGVLYPEFLSTPSGWRATPQVDFIHKRMSISIHALRVEGDNHGLG